MPPHPALKGSRTQTQVNELARLVHDSLNHLPSSCTDGQHSVLWLEVHATISRVELVTRSNSDPFTLVSQYSLEQEHKPNTGFVEMTHSSCVSHLQAL